MNAVCMLQPRFFELLECQPCQLSIAQLSRCLLEFFREKQVDVRLPEEHYISTIHDTTKELIGIYDDKYIIWQNSTDINQWWNLVTNIYNRWKLI